ncbi:ankyrin repeat domain-containing protein [Blastopirellula sp. J2-11]|uniref:ankyrin repeat domain-containing protein n=1 Tax=Blastopirellula sp. J2-11 TaxID=2943192 RepID=UPI0021C56800|nr:ankyrin repeat domain-containing protein [Blastopirellula sp. J2-11]UUO06902.1 ankyrin repeat domain-containing protein [Blastopirellula sp. J2-11]
MMRSLLIILAIATAQAGFYFWRLRPAQFEWESLSGVALMTLTVIFWSAVLQIAWRDKADSAVDAEPQDGDPSRSQRYLTRPHWAGLFVLLAIPSTLGVAGWSYLNGEEAYRGFQQRTLLAHQSPGPNGGFSAIASRGRFPTRYYAHTYLNERQATPDFGSQRMVSTRIEAKIPLLIEKIRSGDKAQIRRMIDAGADVNAANPESGLTPLDEAWHCGDPTIIEMLEQAGAIPSPDA